MLRQCAFLISSLIAGAVSLYAQDVAPPRISQQIADVEWQVMPADVYGVRMGPDQRTWFSTSRRSRSSADRRIAWAREYTQPDPQEQGIPILFQPDGKVWFSDLTDGPPQARLLLRYDGKQWIDHHLPLADLGNALYVAGRAFFSFGNQIVEYDGNQWTASELWRLPPGASPGAVLSAPLKAEPDGQGLVVCCPAAENALMRWRDGKWKPILIPVEALGDIRAFQPDRDGVWMIVDGPRLLFAAYDNAAGVPGLNALIRDFSSDDANVRIAAQQRLIAGGTYASKALETRLQSAKVQKNVDLTARVQAIVDQTHWQDKNPIKAMPATFGPATIGQVQMLAAGPQGRIFIGGQNVTVGTYQGGPAVIMRDPEGNYLSNRGDDVLRRWKLYRNAVPTPQGEAIWLPGDGDQAGIALFDLRTGRLTHRCPDPAVTMPVCGTADGLLYARAGTPSGPRTLMRYAPGRPKAHVEINSIVQWAVGYDSAIEAAGSVISYTNDDGFQRFCDGMPVKTPQIDEFRDTRHMATGSKGGVLLYRDDRSRWELVAGDKVVAAKSLKNLITENTALFAQTFGQFTGRGASLMGDLALATDRAGRIWLGSPRQGAEVLVNGQWISIADQLQDKAIPGGRIVYASAVGDGSSIYLSNNGVASKSVGVLASFVDDKLVLRDATGWTGPTSSLPVRSPDGALWVHGPETDPKQPNGWHAYALTEKGVVARVTNSRPGAADQFGNIFFTRTLDGSRYTLVIWRDGEVRSDLTLAGLNSCPMICTADEAHILVWTGSYLQELVRDGPQPGCYRPGRLIIARFGYGTLEDLASPQPDRLLAKLFVNRADMPRECVILDLAPLLAPATQPSITQASTTAPAPDKSPIAYDGMTVFGQNSWFVRISADGSGEYGIGSRRPRPFAKGTFAFADVRARARGVSLPRSPSPSTAGSSEKSQPGWYSISLARHGSSTSEIRDTQDAGFVRSVFNKANGALPPDPELIQIQSTKPPYPVEPTSKPNAPAQQNTEPYYYSADDGRTWFAASTDQIPPCEINGRMAVFAFVFAPLNNPDAPFLGYLMQYDKAAKDVLQRVAAEGRPPTAEEVQVVRQGTLVKRPGDPKWVPRPEAAGITNVRTSDGQPTFRVLPE